MIIYYILNRHFDLKFSQYLNHRPQNGNFYQIIIITIVITVIKNINNHWYRHFSLLFLSSPDFIFYREVGSTFAYIGMRDIADLTKGDTYLYHVNIFTI